MAIFRYPGGKARIAKQIASFFENPEMTAYAEVFCGGASVAIEVAKNNKNAHILLNDINPRVCAFWTELVTNPESLADEVRNYVPTVEDYVSRKNNLDAMSTLIINRCSHSGRGGGPIGGMTQKGEWLISARWNNKRLSDEILEVGKLLQGRCEIQSIDAPTLISDLDDCFNIYLDPPYVKAGPKLYEFYFREEDHQRLSEVLNKKDNWVLSYDDDEQIKKCYLMMPEVSTKNIQVLSANHSGGGKKQNELLFIKMKNHARNI